jgi:hypothetical protein
MRKVNMAIMAVSFLLAAAIAGCAASGPTFKESSESSKSSIRAAEEVGAAKVSNASLYLQLAKEELENAEALAADDKNEQATSMLKRAEADAELAITLSHEKSEKAEAAEAIDRARQLRIDNQLPN